MTAGAVMKTRSVMLNPRFFKYYVHLGTITTLFFIGCQVDNWSIKKEMSMFMNKSGCFPARDLGPGNKKW